MGDRYWISGVQLGILLITADSIKSKSMKKLLKEIEDKQFIGRIEEEDKDKKVVEIVDKEKK